MLLEVLFEGFFERFDGLDGSDFFWDGVPHFRVSLCCVVNGVCWGCYGFMLFICWDVVVSLLGVPCWVLVYVADWGVGVIVLWSVQLGVLVDEGVCFCAYSKGVEVVDVEGFKLLHEGVLYGFWVGRCISA